MFGAISFVPLFAQGALGSTATEAGSLLTPLMVSWVIMSVVGGRLMLKLSYRSISLVGFVLLTVGFVFLAMFEREMWRGWLYADLILIGSGLGLTMLTLLIAVQQAVDKSELGVATSLNQFARSIGGAFGVAVMGAVLSAGLAENLNKAAADNVISQPQAEAFAANPNALIDPQAQAGLPSGALDVLRDAMASSIQKVFWVGALLAALSLLVALLLPRANEQNTNSGTIEKDLPDAERGEPADYGGTNPARIEKRTVGDDRKLNKSKFLRDCFALPNRWTRINLQTLIMRKELLSMMGGLLAGAMAGGKQGSLESRTVEVDSDSYAYQLYIPAQLQSGQKPPVIIFLHGIGQRGSGGFVPTEGAVGALIRHYFGQVPAIVLLPQCRHGSYWSNPAMDEMVMKSLAQTVKEFGADENRIYLTGVSMGGYGVWHFAAAYPEDSPRSFPSAAEVRLQTANDSRRRRSSRQNSGVALSRRGRLNRSRYRIAPFGRSVKSGGRQCQIQRVCGRRTRSLDERARRKELMPWLLSQRR
jgi:MFS family permease